MRCLAGMAAFLVLGGCSVEPDWSYSPARPIGAPLRSGDRIYAITRQIKTPDDNGIDSLKSSVAESYAFLDLWAFDAPSATTVWRKRLLTEKPPNLTQAALFGAEGDTLWILLASGLTAVSAKSGDILADASSIEARNAALQGKFPKERSYFSFGANGMQVRTTDGRPWRIEPDAFMVADAKSPSANAIAPAYHTNTATYVFQQRSLNLTGWWLGLLNDDEAALLRDKSLIGELDHQSRRKLWSARVKPSGDAVVPRPIFFDLAPLSGEFLGPGLLSMDRRPLLYKNPDSVLVLYQDKLGEGRRLQLTRISGPAGKPVWNVTLPIAVLQSVMPGEPYLFLWGAAFQPRLPGESDDSLQRAHTILMSLDVTKGSFRNYDLSDITRNPLATDATKKPQAEAVPGQ